MTLSALIKKGGLTYSATATRATEATHKMRDVISVAPKATVAAATNPESLNKPRNNPTLHEKCYHAQGLIKITSPAQSQYHSLIFTSLNYPLFSGLTANELEGSAYDYFVTAAIQPFF